MLLIAFPPRFFELLEARPILHASARCLLVDATNQAAQHTAEADLDEGARILLAKRLDALLEAHGMREVVDQALTHGCRIERRGVGVTDDRDDRLLEVDGREILRKRLARRLHERTVKCPGRIARTAP